MKRDSMNNKPSFNKKVLILKPSKESIKRVKHEMRIIFRSDMPMEGVIRKLNPVIRG